MTPFGKWEMEQREKRAALPNPEALEASVKVGAESLRELVELFFDAVRREKGKPYCEACKRSPINVDVSAKAAMNMMKLVDEGARLGEFAQGRADSRTAVEGLDSLLPKLKDHQFNQLIQWLEENDTDSGPEGTLPS